MEKSFPRCGKSGRFFPCRGKIFSTVRNTIRRPDRGSRPLRDRGVRCQPVHRHHRKAPGPESCLSGRNRLPQGLARCRATGKADTANAQKPLWALSEKCPKRAGVLMQSIPTAIPDVLILEPRVFSDARGFFYESFNAKAFQEATGLDVQFVQDNHSKSNKGVLRGLHYQIKRPQGKLVRVVQGEVFDVAVDLRKSAKTFGKWVGVHLSAENKKQLWVPEGFAHGFVVLSETAEFLYKTTDYYAPEYERSLLWNDLALEIDWPFKGDPKLAAKDAAAMQLYEAEVFP